MNEAVLYKIDDTTGIGTITMNRPDVLNAIDVATAVGLADAMLAMKNAANLKVILLEANGRAFVAGGDLSGFKNDYDNAKVFLDQLLDPLDTFVNLMHDIGVPVVGSVAGAAAGAGLSIVAACDVVISTQSAKYVLAYNQVAAVPDCGGSWNLTRKIGAKNLAAMMYLGESWNAEQALQNGLITKIVADDELKFATDKFVAKIAQGPSVAFAQFKALANSALTNDLQSQLDAERAAFKQCIDSDDFKIGVDAFLNRQKPQFTGK